MSLPIIANRDSREKWINTLSRQLLEIRSNNQLSLDQKNIQIEAALVKMKNNAIQDPLGQRAVEIVDHVLQKVDELKVNNIGRRRQLKE